MIKLHIFLLHILLIFHREVHKAQNRIFSQLFNWPGFKGLHFYFFCKGAFRSDTEIKTLQSQLCEHPATMAPHSSCVDTRLKLKNCLYCSFVLILRGKESGNMKLTFKSVH